MNSSSLRGVTRIMILFLEVYKLFPLGSCLPYSFYSYLISCLVISVYSLALLIMLDLLFVCITTRQSAIILPAARTNFHMPALYSLLDLPARWLALNNHGAEKITVNEYHILYLLLAKCSVSKR